MDEFSFLKHLKQHFRFEKLGDDCAVLPVDEKTEVLATADMLVEGVDFRLEWTDAVSLGHKALAVSLSDVAAMGGSPLWALVSIAVPERLWNQQFLDGIFDGIKSLADVHSVEVVGGDVSETGDLLVIDSIVLGKCGRGRSILRAGARTGDRILVSGALGGAAAGLFLLEDGIGAHPESPHEEALVQKQLQPSPQTVLGNILGQRGLVHSMIDISDGLSSDLSHLCEASCTGASIDADRVPIDPGIVELNSPNSEKRFPDEMSLALNGGEDFELLMTAGEDCVGKLEELGCVVIGEVLPDPKSIVLVSDGDVKPLRKGGYRHFD